VVGCACGQEFLTVPAFGCCSMTLRVFHSPVTCRGRVTAGAMSPRPDLSRSRGSDGEGGEAGRAQERDLAVVPGDVEAPALLVAAHRPAGGARPNCRPTDWWTVHDRLRHHDEGCGLAVRASPTRLMLPNDAVRAAAGVEVLQDLFGTGRTGPVEPAAARVR
jgi:hypothetical protein